MKKIISIFVDPKKTVESVVTPHLAALYSQAFKYLGARAAAEDLLQDVLVYVLEHESQVLSLDPVRPWLMRCLYHRFIDEYRKRRKEKSTYLDCDNDMIVCQMPLPEDICFHQEILDFLQMLVPEQRAAVSLFDIEGYSVKQTAQIMGMPTGTVKSHLHRGRKNLKNLIGLSSIEVNEQLGGFRGYKNELY